MPALLFFPEANIIFPSTGSIMKATCVPLVGQRSSAEPRFITT